MMSFSGIFLYRPFLALQYWTMIPVMLFAVAAAKNILKIVIFTSIIKNKIVGIIQKRRNKTTGPDPDKPDGGQLRKTALLSGRAVCALSGRLSATATLKSAQPETGKRGYSRDCSYQAVR